MDDVKPMLSATTSTDAIAASLSAADWLRSYEAEAEEAAGE
jgi:hypothetical protein